MLDSKSEDNKDTTNKVEAIGQDSDWAFMWDRHTPDLARERDGPKWNVVLCVVPGVVL